MLKTRLPCPEKTTPGPSPMMVSDVTGASAISLEAYVPGAHLNNVGGIRAGVVGGLDRAGKSEGAAHSDRIHRGNGAVLELEQLGTEMPQADA